MSTILDSYSSSATSSVAQAGYIQESTKSSQSLASSGRDDEQIWNIIYRELRKLRAPESSIESIRVQIFQESTPSELSCPDTASSLGSTVPIIETDNDKN